MPELKPEYPGAIDEIFELTVSAPELERIISTYKLSDSQLIALRQIAQRRYEIAVKCFNGPELNQVSYKYIYPAIGIYRSFVQAINELIIG